MLLPLNVLRKTSGFDRGRMDSTDVTQKGEIPWLCHAWIASWRAVATALDLEKLGSNPEMVVRGDPNESKLFMAVDDEIMPNADEGEDPLPAKEKAIIRRWIKIGAPTEQGISPK